jgi:hypothetical protein
MAESEAAKAVAAAYKPGDTIPHQQLGQCQVRKVHLDGSITVCAERIPSGTTTNIFRLRMPFSPSWWRVERETQGGF